jgi:hypothetical protein
MELWAGTGIKLAIDREWLETRAGPDPALSGPAPDATRGEVHV